MMPVQTRLSKVVWLLLAFTAAGLSLALFSVGYVAYRVRQSNTLHCYWLSPPLNHTETAILNGRMLNCVVDHCRVALSTQLGSGLVCYYPHPTSQNSLTNSSVPP